MKKVFFICVFFMVNPSWIGKAEEPLLSFDQALIEIMGRSTVVGIQESNLFAAKMRILPARFVFLPSVSLIAKQIGSNNLSFPSFGRQIEADAQLNLFKFGADLEGLNAAREDEEVQSSLLLSESLRAEEEGIKALITEIERKKELGINDELVRLYEESLHIAKQRYERGYLPMQEIQKVSIDLDNAKSKMTDAEIREFESRSSLEALLGHSRVSSEWPWIDRIKRVSFQKLGVNDFEISQRPDLQAAISKVEAEDRRFKQTQRLVLPSLDANLSYGYSNGDFTNGGPYSRVWSGTLTLSVPLFEHFTTYSASKIQAYTLKSAELALEQTRRVAKSEFESAKKSFELSLSSASSRDKTLKTSREIYQDSLKRFRSGRANANELALDQDRLLTSELFAVQGWSTAHLAFSRLCHSMGKRVSDCQ